MFNLQLYCDIDVITSLVLAYRLLFMLPAARGDGTRVTSLSATQTPYSSAAKDVITSKSILRCMSLLEIFSNFVQLVSKTSLTVKAADLSKMLKSFCQTALRHIHQHTDSNAHFRSIQSFNNVPRNMRRYCSL